MGNQKDQVPVAKRFWRFALVGTAGFFVDSGVLLLVLEIGADIYIGRMFSFFCAATATWYMNRVFTFASQNPNLLKEWGHFMSANAIGGFVNYLTYAALVTWLAWFNEYPVVAVAVGSLSGLAANFLLSDRLVFAAPKSRVADAE